jgi:DNA polymerase-3 subunit delta'
MFDDVIGQETAKRILQRQIASSRIPPAYLFQGPAGVGKRQMAFSFARAANCQDATGCGRCSHCRKIARYVHPDVHVLFPVPSSMKSQPLIDLFEMGRECDFRFPAREKTSISIGAVRSITKKVLLEPYEARLKVGIVVDADMMTIEASNAFLKTLEEPPSHTVFILVTAKPHHLPPTILSRCQPIRFRDLSQEEIIIGLKARGVDPDQMLLTSRLSVGSLGRALLLSQPEYLETRKRLLDEFLTLRDSKQGGVVDFALWVVSECDRSVFAELFLSFYRDLLVLKEGEENLVHNTDRLQELRTRAARCETKGILASMERIRELASEMDRSINLKTALPPLLSRLA